MRKIKENKTVIPQIWFEKMEALDAASEGTRAREVIRMLPYFLPLLEDILPVREGMEGGRRSWRSARPPISVPSVHLRVLSRGSRWARGLGVHVGEEWVPHPRMRGRGPRGAGGLSFYVNFRVCSFSLFR